MSTIVRKAVIACAAVMLSLAGKAGAAIMEVQIEVQNLAPANGIAFAPLHISFHRGVFDAFNLGQVATAPIISVAEGGSGSAWLPAFRAADPGATIGTILPAPLLPGGTAMAMFTVDTALNPFFTFASMVVPSNDFFIGNDSPTRYRLFDSAGNLLINSILQTASDIWDAGSELFDPAAAAFVGNNDLRTPQNGTVQLNFMELAGFNGLLTAAGYTFNSQLAANTDVYRISFRAFRVPEPGTLALLAAFGLFGAPLLRRLR